MAQHLGYRRVSTTAQSTGRQLVSEDLASKGITLDCVFEVQASGSSTQRPQLDALLAHLRAGDTVHVHSIDRLARNLQDLMGLVNAILARDASIHFHHECLEFKAGGSAMQKLQLQLMGSFAEFERSIINERAEEGRAVARAKGVKFGRPAKLNKKEQMEIRQQHADGKSVSKLALDFDVSRPAIYRVLSANVRNEEKGKIYG